MNKLIAAAAALAFAGAARRRRHGHAGRGQGHVREGPERGQRTRAEPAFAAFAADDGGFKDKDLYVFCMDMDGVMLFHAVKPELVGKNLLDFNKYGDELFKDMIKAAQGIRRGLGRLQLALPRHRRGEGQDQLCHDQRRRLLLRRRRLQVTVYK
jgi:cytochrome c